MSRRAVAAVLAVALAAVAVTAAVTRTARILREAGRALEDFAAFDGGESGSADPLGAVIDEMRRSP